MSSLNYTYELSFEY